jgi:gluconolactonase
MTDFTEIASGLMFPEGPVALPDGSVLVVEIVAGRLSRVAPDGTVSVVANTGGGPNGAAIGPDGKCYVCNNGGFEFTERNGKISPGAIAKDYTTGRIERVDIDTGEVEVLYADCDGEPLKGPNDIVFDASGGFWFTDHGKHHSRSRDLTGIFYAQPDGSKITEMVFPMDGPNGIGLSPDEKTLYVAETPTGRLWSFDLAGPGEFAAGGKQKVGGPVRGNLVVGVPGHQLFDSLAVDSAGNICVATLANGGITVVSPDGSEVEHIPFPDRGTTNICFGGPDLKTAYITLGTTGRLVSVDWPRPGLALNFLNK